MAAPEWKHPRPPLLRLCTFNWTSSNADWGGVWQLYSYHDLDTPNEIWELECVMSAKRGGPTGHHTKLHRSSYEGGALNVFRSDLRDPKYCIARQPIEYESPDALVKHYQELEAELHLAMEQLDAHFMPKVKAALASGTRRDLEYVDILLKQCPDSVTKCFMLDAKREHMKKRPIAKA